VFRSTLLCASFLGLVLATAAPKTTRPPRPTPQQTYVLFLSASDPDLPDVTAMVEQTETRIVDGSNKPVHFSFEYLEPSSSFADASRQRATASYLLEKYRAQTFDLVIAIDEETVGLAEMIRAKLFPDAALLFFVTDPQNLSGWLNPKTGRTGVIRKSNYLSTLQLALRQNPGTSQVIVISGSSEDEKAATKIAREQFRPYEANIEFQYLTNLHFSELEPRLEHIPPDGVIMFIDFVTDSGGEQFIPARILPAISEKANRPIYGMFSSLVGAGVVGGSVASLGEVGRVLGNDGLRILKGEKPEKVPVTTSDFQHYVIDWRQLHRWGIPESEIPKEGEVRFWQYSPWELYRWRILGLSSLLLLETLLIVLLLRNIGKRKEAEESSRESAAREQTRAKELETVLDAVPIPVRIAHDAGCLRMTGNREAYQQARVPVGQNFSSSAAPGERPRYRLMEDEAWVAAENLPMQQAAATGMPVYGRALTVVYEDGTRRETVESAVPLVDEAGKPRGAVGTSVDVTEQKQAEKSLRESELRFRTVYERSPVGIALMDSSTGLFLQVNPKFCEITGLKEEELLLRIDGRTIIHPDVLGEPAQNRQQLTNEEALSYETDRKYVRSDGSVRWMRVLVVPVAAKEEDHRWQMALVEDITERKAAEEVRARLAAIVESSDDAVISMNLDGIIMSWNQAAERIFGFSEAEAAGQPITILIPSDRPGEEKTILQKLRAGERIQHHETVRVTKEGKRINVSLTVSPMRDVTGRIVGASKIARDVTDRKRAEQALQESETRFRLMANTAPVMIWTSGPDKLCDYFNQPWLDFTGRPVSAELGNGWAEGVHPDDQAWCLDTYAKAFDARQPFEMEYRIRRHDGEYRWIFDAAVPRFSGDHSFVGYIGSCIDVTDRKLAGEALSSIGRKLIEGQEKERNRIARELHDDINQRLALLANGLQEIEQATSAQNSSSRKKHLHELWQLTSEIATDIQHMSHQLHPSKLHYLGLATAVRDLCREFSLQYKIEVECLAENLPEDIEENTSLNLFRVVQESLRNVVKHGRARHVKVELTCQSSTLNLRVSDDGVGFSPEDRREKHGLGLISMRERLRSLGGELSIWSKPSLGTQVEGQVPVTQKHVDKAEESAAD
jgi:PAS domain S-box-containing protein